MIYQVCSVYDTQAKAFLQPFFSRTTDEAQRMIRDVFRDPQHPLNVHYQDYSLYHLATYDDVSGRIEALSDPQRIATLKELKAPYQVDLEEHLAEQDDKDFRDVVGA